MNGTQTNSAFPEELSMEIERLSPRLYRTAYMYLGAEADALDAVDEAVYRSLRDYERLSVKSFYGTWLTRILINVCKDELKRRQRFVNIDEIPEPSAEDFDSLPLRDAVSRLPEELSTVVSLRYFGDYTLKDTADILSLPVGTIAERQRRALALLRLQLK